MQRWLSHLATNLTSPWWNLKKALSGCFWRPNSHLQKLTRPVQSLEFTALIVYGLTVLSVLSLRFLHAVMSPYSRKVLKDPFLIISDETKEEVWLGGGSPRHCFFELMPGTEYKISIYAQLQEIEGPPAIITETTRKWICFLKTCFISVQLMSMSS